MVVPSVLFCGGDQLSVTAPVPPPPDGAAATATLKPVRLAVPPLPSLTVMVMLGNVPVAVGVPDNLPVELLMVIQAGWPVTLKVSVSLSASEAVGVKEYAVPTVAEVGGAPEIVGAWFVALGGGVVC